MNIVFFFFFSSLLDRSVPVGHDGVSAGLSEEGEGEDSCFPGFGAAGSGCQDRNPTISHEDP